jgi:outer membrane protein OmpA-like peptidoglycan-associated protein
MKRLQRYEEFKNNQVQEEIDWKNLAAAGLATIGSITGSPKQASGQTKKPTEIVQSVGVDKKDLLGRPLTAPPIVDKTTGRSTENLGKGKSLLTLKEVNPSEKRLKELKAKGWEVIMTEGGENKPKWGIKTGQKKPGVEFKNDNDKFFELGGYKLTEEIKEKIKGQIEQMGGVDSIQIESSTDKTPLTPRLKADLESKGYSGDNKGLSKARSNAIKSFLISLGVNPENITVVNLADEGKEGGYDPSARYVKLILVEKGGDAGSGTEYFVEGDVIVWLQTIKGGPQKKPKWTTIGGGVDCEGGKCHTYD